MRYCNRSYVLAVRTFTEVGNQTFRDFPKKASHVNTKYIGDGGKTWKYMIFEIKLPSLKDRETAEAPTFVDRNVRRFTQRSFLEASDIVAGTSRAVDR